jgi:hypothetical protein
MSVPAIFVVAGTCVRIEIVDVGWQASTWYGAALDGPGRWAWALQ